MWPQISDWWILDFGFRPENLKSKIPQDPKSLWWFWILDLGDFGFWNPKSKIPQSKIQNPNFFGRFWGFWILDRYVANLYVAPNFGLGDFGFWISPRKSKIQNPQDPKSEIPKIQNPQDPKSKIPKIPNPKSSAKIQNLGRWGPHIKNCYITIQNPRCKIAFWGFWILGDFGLWGFWISEILEFGFWWFWILDFGDFGFWGFGIFGDFGAFVEVQKAIWWRCLEVRGLNPPWSAFQGQCKTKSIWYSWSKKANWAAETGGAGSKDYILHIFTRFLGVYMHV